MPTTTIAGRTLDVNEEGFMTNPDQWDEALGAELAKLIGLEMTEAHWAPTPAPAGTIPIRIPIMTDLAASGPK